MGLPKIGCRHVMVFWSFLGFVIVYMLRINLSVALVVMVNSTATKKASTDSECPDNLNSSTVGHKSSGEFNWDETQQGIILGSFFWGYLVTQLPGGWYAERKGGKWLFGLGVFCTSIFTLLTPLAARWNIYALIGVRVIEGLGEAVTFPAMHAILSHWAPPFERSKLACFAYSGCQMGTIIGLPLSGVLCDSSIAGGWPSVFYIFGGIGCAWFLCWSLIVYDTPNSHPRIEPEEQHYIISSVGIKKSAPSVPWRKIFTSVPFWALLIAHVCHNWTWYTVLTTLPTFMSEVLKFDIKENGFLSCLPYICDWIMIMIVSQVADFLRVRQILSTGAVRKLFNSMGLAVAGICLVATSYAGCDAFLPVLLFCVGLAFLGCCQTGYNINHLDIAPQFAGTLAGITNTFATLPGIGGPYLVGVFTQGQETRQQWQKVFYVAAAVDLLGLLVFLFFGSGQQQEWARVSATSDEATSPLLREREASEVLYEEDSDRLDPMDDVYERHDVKING